MSSLKVERLDEHLKIYREQYGAVLAFRPTGWTYSEKIGEHLDLIKPTSRGKITIYGVPYSEHSSFTELREFVQVCIRNVIILSIRICPG
jgi:DNA cross-link repair 1A protein